MTQDKRPPNGSVFQVKGRATPSYIIVEDKLAVVDVCYPSDATRIVSLVTEKWKQDASDISLVILTHSHVDHVNGVDRLVCLTGAKLAAYPASFDFLIGAKAIPAASWCKQIEFLRFLKRYRWPLPTLKEALSMSRSGIPGLKKRIRTNPEILLSDGKRVPGHLDWVVIHTPGHTPDGICLYNSEKKALITGDTIIDDHGLALNHLLELDKGDVVRSFARLKQLQVENVYPGWGDTKFGRNILESVRT